MGCGDRNVTFIEQHTKNLARSKKLSAWSPKGPHIQTQAEGKPRRWSIVACGPCYHERTFFSRESQLYIYQSPTMKHMSRTHRVGLDWLLDWINLDPKIQNKSVDTKEQLADTLTKGNSTRDEWNHLLRLLNIRNFSTISCSFIHFSFWFDQEAVRHVKERVQESELKERSAVAKPKKWMWASQAWGNFLRKSPVSQSLDQSGVSARSWKVCEGHQRWPDNVFSRETTKRC